MKKTLEAINALVQDGVSQGYAIGGAVAAIMLETDRPKDQIRLTLFAGDAK